nr:CapA family protein [Microbacterium esteraromaticum]
MTGPSRDARVSRRLVETALPVRVEYIGAGAFERCSSLRHAAIPFRITSVPDSVFAGCSALESVGLHSEITAIGARAFAECTALQALKLPSAITRIDRSAIPVATAVVAPAGSTAAQAAERNGLEVRLIERPRLSLNSQFDSPDAAGLEAVLDDPAAMAQLLDYYEIRPALEEFEREDASPDAVSVTPSRFAWSEGVYQPKRPGGDAPDADVTIAMAGDLMCGARQQRQARQDGSYDFHSQLQRIAPVLRQADLAIGNLETMSSEIHQYTSERLYADDRPHLNAPPAYLAAVRNAGFDAVMCAQNHMYDTGVSGVFHTLHNLNRAQLVHGGMFAGPDEPRHLLFDIKGMRIAVVGYLDPARQRMKQVTFSGPGLRDLASLFDKDRVRSDMRAAREAGAEFIIAYAHWGAEYTDRITRTQAAFAKLLVDAGAGYVFGSHSHCPQRYEVLVSDDGRRVPVVYSGGNFLSDISRHKPITQDSLIASLSLTRGADGKVAVKGDGYVPCRIIDKTRGGEIAVAPIEALETGLFGFTMDEAIEDAQRISRTLGPAYTPLRADRFRASDDPDSARADFGPSTSVTIDTSGEHPNDFGSNPFTLLGKEPLESALLEAQTLAMGLRSSRYSRTLFTAQSDDGASMGFRRSASSLSSFVGVEFCADKAVCKALLQANDIPTAVGMRMPHKGLVSAKRFVAQHGWPVVVKPRKGAGGRAVTANIRDENALRQAVQHADAPGGFLIEKHVPGEDYRFLVTGDQVIGVWRRDAANVVGDGTHTVDLLIDRKNAIRGRNPHVASRPIQKDALVREHLAREGRDLTYVPAKQEKVYLRSAANLSSGGDNIEITDETHPTLIDLAVRAQKLLPQIELVGIDILLEDHRKPLDEQSVHICEINSTPGVSAHDFPVFGPPRASSRMYVEHIAARSGVPLSSYRESGSFELVAHGVFDGDGFETFLRAQADLAGVRVSSVHVEQSQAIVAFEGSTTAAAAFNCLCIAPPPRHARLEFATLTPTGPGDV